MTELDFEAYRRANFVEPAPEPRFAIRGVHGATLYFAEYERAVHFYTEVLGPPGYVEGTGTRAWRLGDTWLTLLAGGDGHPTNTEVPIVTTTPGEAERLHAAFLAAGAVGESPSDQLMGEPIRYCPVTDPFGTDILVYARLEDSAP